MTLSALRAVATTALPAPSAALAMSTPMPRAAPVINQIFLSVMTPIEPGADQAGKVTLFQVMTEPPTPLPERSYL